MERWMIVPYRNGLPQKPLVAPSLREAIEWCQRGTLKPPLPFRPLEKADGKDIVFGEMITPGEKGVYMGDPLGDGRFVLRYRIEPIPVVGCVSAVVLHDLHPVEDGGAVWIHHRPVTVYQLPGPPTGEAVLDVMADHLRTWAGEMEELDLPGPWTLHVWACSPWENMQAIRVTAHRPPLEELQKTLVEGPPDPNRLVVALFHEHAPDRLREAWPVRLGNQPLDWLPLAVASLHQDGFPVRLVIP